MSLIGFDNDCGMLSTSVHPFTSTLARYDTRITTHYYEDNFISNMYSIIHEGGHAIFGQNEPREIYDNHLQNSMTMAMHESVSRFYENRLGRSKEFIHFIYPKIMELFSEELGDVSEEELYLGINAVMKQPLRTEADELSYCLHIIIRYELEKEFVDTDNFDFSSLEKDGILFIKNIWILNQKILSKEYYKMFTGLILMDIFQLMLLVMLIMQCI